jgi:hypothetical protein
MIIPYLRFADLAKHAEQQSEFARNIYVMCRLWRTMIRVIDCAKDLRDWSVQDHILSPKEQAFGLALKDFEMLVREVEAEKQK